MSCMHVLDKPNTREEKFVVFCKSNRRTCGKCSRSCFARFLHPGISFPSGMNIQQGMAEAGPVNISGK